LHTRLPVALRGVSLRRADGQVSPSSSAPEIPRIRVYKLVEKGLATVLQYLHYCCRFGKTELRRLCRDCLPPFRWGTPAKTPAAERGEFDMYLSLMEKLCEISLETLPSQSYIESGACEVAEDPFRCVL